MYVVRERGLEPRHLSVLDPKSSASANSAILAGCIIKFTEKQKAKLRVLFHKKKK
jgi:hypothetical protein